MTRRVSVASSRGIARLSWARISAVLLIHVHILVLQHVEVVPHNPAWHEEFEREAAKIRKAVRNPHLPIHHIGSTSIPGISAKPIIDMLVEVADIRRVADELNGGMIRLGYFPAGAFGVSGRKLFIKGDDRIRTHHVHVYQSCNPEIAKAYDRLKQNLARQHEEDVTSYYKGKTAFLEDIARKAAGWKATLNPSNSVDS